MKVVFTEDALRDLEEITAWLRTHYPGLGLAVERRMRTMVDLIARWPEGMRRSAKREAVRVVPLGRYPYKIFYRVREDTVEILHIHHAARQPWDEES
jgi:plasmid stabilization system protein ParE